MPSTSSEAHSTTASHRSHDQGRQSNSYTPAQEKAVNRVRSCAIADYYAILDIEKPSSEVEIRKSYRKLALIMHPDKNSAPGADEAFKLVSKAFQVLSDPDKKRIFDQTGADPDSRFSGMPGGSAGGGSPFRGFGGGGGPAGMDNISPEELFNMFFNGGAFGGGGFGGPNIRVHTFGNGFGGGSPFTAFTTGPGGAAARGAARHAAQNENPFSIENLVQLGPILLLLLLMVVTSLFGGNSSANVGPQFKFSPEGQYTTERVTPNHHIPYYVSARETRNLNDRKMAQLDQRAELSYVQIMKTRCYNEYEYKQQKISDSKGWFFVNEEAYNEALNMPLKSCEILDELGVAYLR
ncbi:hypothetical protein TRVA0_004S03862 [Trichomonascus vanleenenianus]|uniref:J domain-containing protein n=1 Tax=Trichomonascus vanleenenianus TaxID=2268995 RepID=UPI003ECB796F